MESANLSLQTSLRKAVLMSRGEPLWLLLTNLCLASFAISQDTDWQKASDAGQKAYLKYDLAEAEKLLLSAVKEAEKFGESDARLATSLKGLGLVYCLQSKPEQGEPLLRRSLSIRMKILAPDDDI